MNLLHFKDKRSKVKISAKFSGDEDQWLNRGAGEGFTILRTIEDTSFFGKKKSHAT